MRTAAALAAVGALVCACSSTLPHAPANERSGIDEEILVAEAEQAGGEPLGARGRALLTVLELRDRATPDAQLDVDVWLRDEIATFEQMTVLQMGGANERVVDHLPAATPYRQAERAYGTWIVATHPETHDDFAEHLYNLRDGVLPEVDRTALATKQLATRDAGRASMAAVRFLERPSHVAAFHASLEEMSTRKQVRALFRRALGSDEPMREEKTASHCRSAEAWPSYEQEQTFLALWRAVDDDETSWNEAVRALADVRVNHATVAAFAAPLVEAWKAHPERRGAVLFGIAALMDETMGYGAIVPFVDVLDQLGPKSDLTAMLAFDPRAVLFVPRLLDSARAWPTVAAFTSGVETLHAADQRLHDARDPSVQASVASYVSHLCVWTPAQATSAKLGPLKQAIAGDLTDPAAAAALFKCPSKVALTTDEAIRRFGSDC